MKASYRIAPWPSESIPPGIPYIVGNEFAERFSYYGMRAILVVFMTRHLLDAAGRPAPMSANEAQGYFHLFVSAAYLTPFLGAIIADGWLGKYRTILALSLVYCLGHLCLAIDDTRAGLLAGQALIALGAGGIKPCVSAHVGDQFGSRNRHWLGKVFSWFYLALNTGAFIAMLLIPWLLDTFGSNAAFGLPGLLMLAATIIFWSGRYRFVHIPPAGPGFIRDLLAPDRRAYLTRLAGIYFFIAMFWALFDQNGSSWVLQAQKMDRAIAGTEVLPSQIQAANPLLIMILTPVFHRWLYPFLERFLPMRYLIKIALGLFLTVLAFIVVALIQTALDAGLKPNIGWQLVAYAMLTSAEVMVSITCLEFSYTQAPPSMKSFVMAFYLGAVALGNLFTGAVNFIIEGSSWLTGAAYFWFFAGLMLMTAIGFAVYSRGYRERIYLQAESD